MKHRVEKILNRIFFINYEDSVFKDYYINKTYILYTIVFTILYFVCFHYVIFDRSFMFRWDGFNQHYTYLLWFSDYIKGIINNFKSLNFHIPHFVFYNGEGNDISVLFNGLIGDPFFLIESFFPKSIIKYLYSFFNVFRVYLIGISFTFLCIHSNIKNVFAIIIGSITYTFCGFFLYNIARHPSFLNVPIFLPLIIFGVNNIFCNKSPVPYILSLAMSLLSSFYFSYMVCIFIGLYLLIKMIDLKLSIKRIYSLIFSFAIYSLVAFLISSIIVIPALYVLKDSSSTTNNVPLDLFYGLGYYKNLLSLVFEAESPGWTYIQLSSFSLIALYYIFINKKYKLYSTILLISIVFLLFPFFGKILNGFGYPSNRWVFIFSFFTSFATAKVFDDVVDETNKNQFKILVLLIIHCVLVLLFSNFDKEIFLIQILISIIILFIINLFKSNKLQIYLFILFLVIISTGLNAYQLFSKNKKNYANVLMGYQEIDDQMNSSFSSALKEYLKRIDDRDFFRYGQSSLINNSRNSSVIDKISSIAYYNSTFSGALLKYYQEFGFMRQWRQMVAGTLDYKVAPISLSNVKYFLNVNQKDVPYGFKLMSKKSDNNLYNIYKNDNFLPLIYSYDKVVNEEYSRKFNEVEKQELMMNAAIISNSNISSDYKFSPLSKTISYRFVNIPDTIDIQENAFVVYKKNTELTIQFDGIENSENNLILHNFDFEQIPLLDFYNNKKMVFNGKLYDIDRKNKYNIKDLNLETLEKLEIAKSMFTHGTTMIAFKFNIDSTNKVFEMSNKYNNYYAGMKNYDINLGYFKKPIKEFKIVFPIEGIYTFDDISAVCHPIDYFSEAVKDLKRENIKNIVIEDDYISAEVDLSKRKYLCLAVPYHLGWKAFVDGKEVEVYQTNIKHFGFFVKEGKHHIEVRYSNPLIVIGKWCSLVGLVLLIILIKNKKLKYLLKNLNEER